MKQIDEAIFGGISHICLLYAVLILWPFNFRDELSSCIAAVRERNNNSLSGLALLDIISMVDKVIKEKASKKQGKYIFPYLLCSFSRFTRL